MKLNNDNSAILFGRLTRAITHTVPHLMIYKTVSKENRIDDVILHYKCTLDFFYHGTEEIALSVYYLVLVITFKKKMWKKEIYSVWIMKYEFQWNWSLADRRHMIFQWNMTIYFNEVLMKRGAFAADNSQLCIFFWRYFKSYFHMHIGITGHNGITGSLKG